MMMMTGGAMAGMGGELDDAGMPMLADAAAGIGGMLAGAGGALSGGSGGSGGAGGSNSDGGDAQAQEPMSDDLPRGHFVLRNSSGAAVDAIVHPTCGLGDAEGTAACSTEVFRSVDDHPCVWVSWLGDRAIDMAFELSSGRVDKCMNPGFGYPDEAIDLLFQHPYTIELVY
jgi:hypothetical protein